MNFIRLGVAMSLCGSLFATAGVMAQGDAEAGAGKIQVCASCHGQNGASNNPEFPSLAGQVPGYLAKQLNAYKSGARENSIMTGMASALSDEDVNDIDAYFSSLKPPVRSLDESQLEDARKGEKIYRGGYRPFAIPACMACHGPGGHGIPPTYPRVSGQQSAYLEAQLTAFKSGQRKHDIMNPIAFKLSLSQIKELALYMSAVN
ncbi:MAG: cytochrome c [marine bacterium B5-7]|nr:MAG: cytochrome c [marine bacterium B5-7]